MYTDIQLALPQTGPGSGFLLFFWQAIENGRDRRPRLSHFQPETL